MGGRVDAEVRVFEDVADANRAIAERILEMTRASIRSGAGRFSLVLAGGGTPRGLYRMLAEEFTDRIDWSHVDLFWGDERYVPHDHPKSNFRMAREALIDHISIPPDNVYPMSTHHTDPVHAVRAYEATLRSYFDDREPRFDLVLLGIGDDGHTASLFPGSPALDEANDWVTVATAPAEPRTRLTLTYPILNTAANVFFLAKGGQKRGAVSQTVAAPPDPKRCPASGIDPESGRLVWWLDDAAAGDLSTG